MALGDFNAAIDDLREIGALCRREGLWFDIDGCIWRIDPDRTRSPPFGDGIAEADSLALDPHKWLQTPFECVCALIRDGRVHIETFTLHGDYLQAQDRGVAAGEFLGDYGYELSRGFKALKQWMSLKEQGVAKFGVLIDQHIAMGQYLAARINIEPMLELMAPAAINIVCFRFCGNGGSEAELKALNTEIMLRLLESGVAVPTDTTLKDRQSRRAAINNHRTTRADLDILISEVLRLGQELQT